MEPIKDEDILQQDNERYEVKYYPNGEDDQDAELIPKRITPMKLPQPEIGGRTPIGKAFDEVMDVLKTPGSFQPKKSQSFEDFLREQWAADYMGTDDDGPDAFDGWMSELDSDTLVEYAKAWGDTLV